MYTSNPLKGLTHVTTHVHDMAETFGGAVSFTPDTTPAYLHQLEMRIAEARSLFPEADLTGTDCRWCGNGKYLDNNGAVRCLHCDAPHDTKKCGICRVILKGSGG
jgi:hypothetical protein